MKEHLNKRLIMLSVTVIVLMLASVGGKPPYATAATVDQTEGPTIEGCPIFPPDNAWNQDISKLRVHPKSKTYIKSIIDDGGEFLHPDFGSPAEYGIPFVVVGVGAPTVPINYVEYGDESDPGPFPIPSNAPVEAGDDRHVLVIETGDCKLYELYHAEKTEEGWNAGSGAIWNMRSNDLRTPGWTSADGAGLPIFPGLVRYDEVTAGEIKHALRFTVENIQEGWVLPAQHSIGEDDDDYPTVGMRFRLKANYNISGFTGASKVILEALKKYGMILADGGGNWFISGETNPNWNDEDIEQLKQVPGSAFEVVDTGPIVEP
jgi:hypothetical protein